MYASGEKVALCHATSSVKNPYVLLELSAEAVQTHLNQHSQDFIAIDGITCEAAACQDAPCAGNEDCCEGLSCDASGICEPPGL